MGGVDQEYAGRLKNNWTAEDVARCVRIEALIGEDTIFSQGDTVIVDTYITNTSSVVLEGTPENPINISYHWLDGNGRDYLVFDGLRTWLGESLGGNTRRHVRLPVKVPEFKGSAILRLSLVQEGRFWFESISLDSTWQSPILIERGEWVVDTDTSIGVRALRGGVAVQALKKALGAKRADSSVEEFSVENSIDKVRVEPDLVVADDQALNNQALNNEDPIKTTLSNEHGVSVGEVISSRTGPLKRGLGPLARLFVWQSRKASTDPAIANLASKIANIEAHFDGLIGSVDAKLVSLNSKLDHTIALVEQRTASLEERMFASTFGGEGILARITDQAADLARIERALSGIGDQIKMSERLAVELAIEIKGINDTLSLTNRQRADDRSRESIVENFEGVPAPTRAICTPIEADEQKPAYEYRLAEKLDFLMARNVISAPLHDLFLCRNPEGVLAVPGEDLATIAYLGDGVLPERGTLSFVKSHLKPGACFVDVGANVGLFTLIAGKTVGPSGRVMAIEPTPSTARALRATITVNGLSDRVTVNELAAGARRTQSSLRVGDICGRNFLVSDFGIEPSDSGAPASPGHQTSGFEQSTEFKSIEVQVVPLDDVIAGAAVDMVKIDVEGWEPQVVDGMSRTIAANPNIIIILEFGPEHIQRVGLTVDQWISKMLATGLQLFEINEENGEISDLRRSGLEKLETMNLVLCSREALGRNFSASGTNDRS